MVFHLKWLELEAGTLRGQVPVQGSKNSSQALIAATALADSPVQLLGVPKLQDFWVIQGLCQDTGMEVRWLSEGTLELDPRGVDNAVLDPKRSSKYRAAYYFVGALLNKLGRVSVGYPGGDDFGQRPIEQHLKGFRALGATVTLADDHYVVEAKQLKGADFYFDLVTMGGTINLMLAAVRAKGTTVLRNAAKDPEVVDVANLLNRMGARVRGAGTDVIRIEGVSELSGCVHTVIPDRLIAGTFLIGAAATGGEVTVTGVIPEHLKSCLAKLTELGIECEVDDQSVTARSTGKLRAVRVRTSAFPGFPTDLQQPLTAALLHASGNSMVVDTVYPNRYAHVTQLRRLGATIHQRERGVIVAGPANLTGEWVHATDVRAGASLILAGLRADGVTRITGAEHIDRGYENVVQAFGCLGATLRVVDGDETAVEPALVASAQAEL